MPHGAARGSRPGRVAPERRDVPRHGRDRRRALCAWWPAGGPVQAPRITARAARRTLRAGAAWPDARGAVGVRDAARRRHRHHHPRRGRDRHARRDGVRRRQRGVHPRRRGHWRRADPARGRAPQHVLEAARRGQVRAGLGRAAEVELAHLAYRGPVLAVGGCGLPRVELRLECLAAIVARVAGRGHPLRLRRGPRPLDPQHLDA